MESEQHSHHYKKEVSMFPGDFKRKYKFKSDTKSARTSYLLAVIISIIAFLLIWYLL